MTIYGMTEEKLLKKIYEAFSFKKKKIIYLFIWLHLILVAGFFTCSMQTLSCGMWTLVP